MMNFGRRRRTVVEECDGVTVVNFVDKKLLDEAVIQQLGEELFALADGGHPKILLNFQNLEYISSAAIGKFLTLDKAVEAGGGKLVLCAIHPQIFEVFKITKLNQRFECAVDLPIGLSILNG